MKNKQGISSLKLLIAPLVFFAVCGLIFSFLPSETFGAYSVGGTTQTNTTIFLNETGEETDNIGIGETFDFLDLLLGLLTFSLDGFPAWVSVIFVYIPIASLLLGIIGLLRGV